MTGQDSDPDVAVHVYVVPSAPETPHECRDVPAVAADRRTFALCDGASAAYRAGDWAHLLAAHFVTDPPAVDEASMRLWLSERRAHWNDETAERPAGDGAVGRQFFRANAVARGSAATFMGVRLSWAAEGWRYAAVAVGDTCLFHVRDGRLLTAFPVTHPASFDDHPDLVGTREPPQAPPPSWLRTTGTQVWPGDELHLVTDALAKVLLTHAVPDAPDAAVWWHVMSNANAGDFARLVRRLRESRQIETDDTTLVRVLFRS